MKDLQKYLNKFIDLDNYNIYFNIIFLANQSIYFNIIFLANQNEDQVGGGGQSYDKVKSADFWHAPKYMNLRV